MALQAVMLDSREPAWVKGLTFDVPCISNVLSAGDAWLQCDDALLVVERKTLDDLLASIADGRLFVQAKGMADLSPWSYLVVTGIPRVREGNVVTGATTTGWQWTSVQGALMTVQEMGVTVLFREADELYKDTLLWLASRERDTVRAKHKREVALQSRAERILCSLPGIDEKLAEIALMVCGSPAKAIAQMCSLLEGSEIPGVAEGKRRGVRNALGFPPDEQFYILKGEPTVTEILDEYDNVQGHIILDGPGLVTFSEAIKRLAEFAEKENRDE